MNVVPFDSDPEVPSQPDFYDEACRAIAVALNAEKVMHIRRTANAARAAARAAGNKIAEIDMAEVRIRAERRVGRIMSMQRDGGLLAEGTRNQLIGPSLIGGSESDPPITLTQMGIGKHLADRARKLEELSDHDFEQLIAAWRERAEGGRSVTLELLDVRKKAERRSDIEKQRQDIAAGGTVSLDGVFNVVAIDPPWNYDRVYDPAAARVASPYPEMTQDELLALQLPFADDCALFLWTTHQFIWDAHALAEHWGFAHKAVLVWDKEHMGMGFWLRMQCEFCLVGIRGEPIWDNTRWRDIIREPRREHSRKPETFYEMVEDITAGRRADIFSREPRPGWASFGNDRERFDGVP